MQRKNSNYIQGVFTPNNPQKYKGSLPIFYRSSLELKVFRTIDQNPNIMSWGSESVVIPYISPIDNKIHRYFVDLNLTLLSNNKYEKYLVEIKPYIQTIAPTTSTRKKPQTILYEKVTYSVNQAKWKAAEMWCAKHNYKFIIYTEKHLKS